MAIITILLILLVLTKYDYYKENVIKVWDTAQKTYELQTLKLKLCYNAPWSPLQEQYMPTSNDLTRQRLFLKWLQKGTFVIAAWYTFEFLL